MSKVKKTFLHSYHLTKLKASIMGPFANYDMPIEYKDLGISKESLNCRKNASIFEVSHMGQMRVYGKDRFAFLEKFLVGDVHKMPLFGCSLSLVLNENAGIIDDVIFSKHNDYMGLVLNAGNKYKDYDHMKFLQDKYFKNSDLEFEMRESECLIAL